MEITNLDILMSRVKQSVFMVLSPVLIPTIVMQINLSLNRILTIFLFPYRSLNTWEDIYNK